MLSIQGIEVSDEILIADLEFLRELELIELVGESGSGHYVLSIPLMGRWIDRQHDFAVLQKKARMETEDYNDSCFLPHIGDIYSTHAWSDRNYAAALE